MLELLHTYFIIWFKFILYLHSYTFLWEIIFHILQMLDSFSYYFILEWRFSTMVDRKSFRITMQHIFLPLIHRGEPTCRQICMHTNMSSFCPGVLSDTGCRERRVMTRRWQMGWWVMRDLVSPIVGCLIIWHLLCSKHATFFQHAILRLMSL